MPIRPLVLLALLLGASGCSVSPPPPIRFDGGTIALRGVSATRSVKYPDLRRSAHLHLGFEVDQPAPAPGTIQTPPKVKLGYIHDEHDRPLPKPDHDHAGWGDLRSILDLTHSDPAANPPPRSFSMGVAGFDRVPKHLDRIGGVLEFLRIPGTRFTEVPAGQLSEPFEIEKGLTMSLRQQPLRSGEVRVMITCLVVTKPAEAIEAGNTGRLPPVPLAVDLLDQDGNALGSANSIGGSTGSTRMESDRVAVVRLGPEQRIDRVRIKLADEFELVSIPFEFRDVPLP